MALLQNLPVLLYTPTEQTFPSLPKLQSKLNHIYRLSRTRYIEISTQFGSDRNPSKKIMEKNGRKNGDDEGPDLEAD